MPKQRRCASKGRAVRVELPDTRRDDEQLAALAKALGHPLRVRILRILASHEGCICGELVDRLPIAQSTVSQHLKILKDAGLVQGEIDGPRVCYCIRRPALRKLKKLVAGL
ncbi:MAG: winged helix-turn-helix transcriptional regulator [Planctomycetes bacterium]|nr:winged helix-turn-helix transcriptional regulator [Planctomycetota bacterium]